jgi:hypothetical protein
MFPKINVTKGQIILHPNLEDAWFERGNDVIDCCLGIFIHDPGQCMIAENSAIVREQHNDTLFCIFFGHIDSEGKIDDSLYLRC